MALHDFGVKLGIRTKKVESIIAASCRELGATEEKAQESAKVIADFLAKDTLLFFTETEAQEFSRYAKDNSFESGKLSAKEIYKISKKVINPSHDGLDIALFGRMVASASEMNFEAAASFSHAISTHKINNEVEFFTALDDRQEEQGSAHMGSLEFNSATYYRYISLNLGQLSQSIGVENLQEAVSAFIKALFIAVPSARQTTQSGASPWEFAKIFIRNGQRLQVPFETSVRARDGGFLEPSIEVMTDYLRIKQKLFGSLFGKHAEYTYGEDEDFNIDTLLKQVDLNIKEMQQ